MIRIWGFFGTYRGALLVNLFQMQDFGHRFEAQKFFVAPRVGDIDSHASVCPLELGNVTHESTKLCGPWSWGYGFPRFGVAPRVGDMDSHASVWPLELGMWTPMLRCGPYMDFHASVWPLKSGIWTPILRCGPLSQGYGLPHFGVAP